MDLGHVCMGCGRLSTDFYKTPVTVEQGIQKQKPFHIYQVNLNGPTTSIRITGLPVGVGAHILFNGERADFDENGVLDVAKQRQLHPALDAIAKAAASPHGKFLSDQQNADSINMSRIDGPYLSFTRSLTLAECDQIEITSTRFVIKSATNGAPLFYY